MQLCGYLYKADICPNTLPASQKLVDCLRRIDNAKGSTKLEEQTSIVILKFNLYVIPLLKQEQLVRNPIMFWTGASLLRVPYQTYPGIHEHALRNLSSWLTQLGQLSDTLYHDCIDAVVLRISTLQQESWVGLQCWFPQVFLHPVLI